MNDNLHEYIRSNHGKVSNISEILRIEAEYHGRLSVNDDPADVITEKGARLA